MHEPFDVQRRDALKAIGGTATAYGFIGSATASEGGGDVSGFDDVVPDFHVRNNTAEPLSVTMHATRSDSAAEAARRTLSLSARGKPGSDTALPLALAGGAFDVHVEVNGDAKSRTIKVPARGLPDYKGIAARVYPEEGVVVMLREV